MAWRDQLRAASFRGVVFHVQTEEMSGGRKTVVHEYPLKDEPFAEDMGRKSRGFTLDGFVIGPNYMASRDQLINALESQGPGALVLPYKGERKVACLDFRVRETVDDGGMAMFSMEFVETPAQPTQPSAAVLSSSIVVTRADAVTAALSEAFGAAFSVLRQPQFAINSLTAILQDAARGLDSALSPIISSAQDLASFKRSVLDLIGTAESLLRTPDVLAADVLAILGLAPSIGGVSRETVSALIQAYDFQTSAATPAATTATRAKELANQVALKGLWRTSCIVQASVASAGVTFESYEDAVAVRDQILTRLDAESEVAADEVFTVLQALRAAVVLAVPGPDNDLVRLVPYTPPTTVPSVVVAYQLYGDLDSEQDLIARNRIRHAGFVPGGVKLQVLGRA